MRAAVSVCAERSVSQSAVRVFPIISKAKLFKMNILFPSEIEDRFENPWKSISHGTEMPCAGWSQAHTHQAAGHLKCWLWESRLNLNWTLNFKKKKGEKITTLKNVWYLKRFSRESRQNLQGSCFIIHPDPCTAHSAFYMLPYVQLTNWDDRNSVCFTAYIFNLHSEILQQKSAGSCDKNNLHVLRDASFFKPHL